MLTTKKRETPNTPRRAEDIDRFRESLALREKLGNRRNVLREKLRQQDNSVQHVTTEQADRVDKMATALLAEPGADVQEIPPPERINEEVAACDRAIDLWEMQHRGVANETAGLLWREDYEENDLEIRNRIVRALTVAAEGQLQLRQHRALANRNGALPGGRADWLPYINCSACGPLARTMEVLANQLGAFKETNRNLLQ